MDDKQYPLAWPMGWPRTTSPQPSRFANVSISAESNEIIRQLHLMGAREVVVSSNMRYRVDGLPYAQQGYIEDKGVAVYFKLNGEEQCIPCDKWNSLGDNLRAISKTIEALRGIDRWGAKEMVDAAFRGFKALPSSIITPPPSDRQKRPWWVVLGVSKDDAGRPQVVKPAYRRALSVAHPDAGGSNEDFQEVQNAYDEWRNL